MLFVLSDVLSVSGACSCKHTVECYYLISLLNLAVCVTNVKVHVIIVHCLT